MESPAEAQKDGWSMLQLPTDVLRHLSSCLGDNTNLAARLGLTSIFWYREVWKWQTRLTVTHNRAAESLVKRKAILENNITHLRVSILCTAFDSSLDSYVAFLRRFAKSPALRFVEISDATTRLRPSLKDIIASFPTTVERFVYQERGGVGFCPAAPLLLAIQSSPCRFNLKRLTLVGDGVTRGDMLRSLAQHLPNLEEVDIPNWKSPVSGYEAVYSHDLDAVAAHLPRLKRLCISDNHPVFLNWSRYHVGNHYSPERLDALRTWIVTVISHLPDGFADVICTPSGSLFEIMLKQLNHTKTVDLGLQLNLPHQICGKHSILVRVLTQCHFSPGSTLALVEALLDPKRNIDLWSTLDVGGISINSLQAAILSADQVLLDVVLGRCRSSGLDTHMLSGSGGKLNIFHVIATIGAQVADRLAALQLLHSRRGPLGISQALVNQENVDNRCTPLEAFIATGRMDCALFIWEQFGANPAPVRDTLASPSLLHFVFRTQKFKDPSVILPLEPIFLDPRIDYKRALASNNVGSSSNWSLLAAIANGSCSQVLHKALKSSSVEQNHLALCEMYCTAPPNLAHEKFLIQAGADPGKNGADGMSPLMWACVNSHPERVKMILQMKGTAAAANKCSYGRRAGLYPAEMAAHSRPFLDKAPELLNSLLLPETIRSDKAALSNVLAGVERYLNNPTGPLNHAIRTMLARVKVGLEKQIKTLK